MEEEGFKTDTGDVCKNWLCIFSLSLFRTMKWLKQLLHPSTINKLWRRRAQIRVFSLAGRAATEEEEMMAFVSFA